MYYFKFFCLVLDFSCVTNFSFHHLFENNETFVILTNLSKILTSSFEATLLYSVTLI